jgi:hypothetical protein
MHARHELKQESTCWLAAWCVINGKWVGLLLERQLAIALHFSGSMLMTSLPGDATCGMRCCQK